MTYVVSISEFRENLFEYADLARGGDEVVVEKNGKSFLLVKSAKDDAKERARRLLAISKSYKPSGKRPTKKEIDEVNEFMRGKKEIEYMKNLGKR